MEKEEEEEEETAKKWYWILAMYMSMCFLMMYIFYISHSIEYRSFFFHQTWHFFSWYHHHKKNDDEIWIQLSSTKHIYTDIDIRRSIQCISLEPFLMIMMMMALTWTDLHCLVKSIDWFITIQILIQFKKKILIWIVEFLPFFKEFCHYEIYFF